MKINSIEIINNPILGNLKLDFRNSKGNPANAVIIAGENGCGKSALLNILYEFSKFNVEGKNSNEERHISVNISFEELTVLKENPNIKGNFLNGIKENNINIHYYFSSNSWDQIQLEFNDLNDNPMRCPSHYIANSNIKHIFRSIFSDIGINFTPSPIRNITARATDQTNVISERTNANLATEISQLLIDIEALDASDYVTWSENNIVKIKSGVNPSKFMHKRMRRFNHAFKTIFDGRKEFLGIRNEEDHKKIYFKERNHEMTIDNLSSGEKQIVFRGGFLLKDQEQLKNEFILIDEPEISLHPHWQLKILNFYKNLFKDKLGNQKSQIFIATHSPFIIHSTDIDDTVIILKKTSNGKIVSQRNSEFIGWSPEIGIRKAFRVDMIFDIDKPILITEGKCDYNILSTAWKKLYPDDDMPFDIIASGIEINSDERSGNAEQVRRALELISTISRLGKTIIGLFDNDREGNEQFKGLNNKIFEVHDISKVKRKHKTKKIVGMILPVPSFRSKFVTPSNLTQRYLEIEHYFEDSILIDEGLKGDSILDTSVFSINSGNKVKFSKSVHKYDRTKFEAFSNLFSEILSLI